ncbi:MAG: hypothetical protein WDM92_09995 [Caulobacteraceae bacterium]
MTTLRDEIAAYESMRSELEAAELGKWAVVHDRALVGVFEDFQSAAQAAVERFGPRALPDQASRRACGRSSGLRCLWSSE